MDIRANTSEECVYCGATEDLTRDHVPPKGLFPPPRPADIVTVPACGSCNTAFQKDDEYFVTTLGLREGVWASREGRDFAEKVRRALERPEATRFASMISSQIQLAEVAAPELDLPAGTYGYVLDAVRLRRTAERIVKGLTFHRTGRRLPSTHSVRAVLLEELNPLERGSLLSPLAGVPPVELAGNRFSYITKAASDDLLSSVWLLDFYADANYVVITGVRPNARAT